MLSQSEMPHLLCCAKQSRCGCWGTGWCEHLFLPEGRFPFLFSLTAENWGFPSLFAHGWPRAWLAWRSWGKNPTADRGLLQQHARLCMQLSVGRSVWLGKRKREGIKSHKRGDEDLHFPSVSLYSLKAQASTLPHVATSQCRVRCTYSTRCLGGFTGS